MGPDPEMPAPAELPGGHRLRWVAFGAVCLVAAGLAVTALVLARRDRDRAIDLAAPVAVAAVDVSSSLTDDVPDLMFQSTTLGDTYGRLATLPLDGSTAERSVDDLSCDRVHYRSNRGVCLRTDRGLVTTYEAIVFDEHVEVVHAVGLAGAPSRVRVSPGGVLAGMTVFVRGHSYAEGGFSTQTTLVDLTTGEIEADLEVDFTVTRRGEPWRSVDFNLWGVTFVDDEEFYATLGTGGEHHLVRGDVTSRELEVVTDGVECPSLSPDGSRIAFKSRRDDGLGPVTWRISVLDLDTMERIELAETRTVDDQVAWLDDDTVMYGLPNEDNPAQTDTWTVPADGSGVPTLLVRGAWSATPVRASFD